MSKKIVSISAEKREMEKSLEELKAFVNGLTPESYRGIFILTTLQDPKDPLNYTIYRAAGGVDWELCGILKVEAERMAHWYYDEIVGDIDFDEE